MADSRTLVSGGYAAAVALAALIWALCEGAPTRLEASGSACRDRRRRNWTSRLRIQLRQRYYSLHNDLLYSAAILLCAFIGAKLDLGFFVADCRNRHISIAFDVTDRASASNSLT